EIVWRACGGGAEPAQQTLCAERGGGSSEELPERGFTEQIEIGRDGGEGRVVGGRQRRLVVERQRVPLTCASRHGFLVELKPREEALTSRFVPVVRNDQCDEGDDTRTGERQDGRRRQR